MLVGFSALAGALWLSKTVGTSWNKLQDILAEVLAQLGVCLCGGVPNFGPGAPKKSQNVPKMAPHFDPGLLGQEVPKRAKLTKI